MSGVQIGELARRLGVTTKTIRFYESSAVLPAPARTESGYRTYGQADVERLTFIKTAQRLGLSLNEIGEILAVRDRGEPPCGYVREVLRRQVNDLNERMKEMGRLRDELRRLEARASDVAGDTASYCQLIEHSAGR
jgi:DNA-binding transcriptional MerR regulator